MSPVPNMKNVSEYRSFRHPVQGAPSRRGIGPQVGCEKKSRRRDPRIPSTRTPTVDQLFLQNRDGMVGPRGDEEVVALEIC
jgi:hypothetical protein